MWKQSLGRAASSLWTRRTPALPGAASIAISRPFQLRPSASLRSAADGYLVELLNAEIEQEHRQLRLPPQPLANNNDNEGKVTVVGPFQLIDKPGMEDVLLTRTFGTEKIEVICMMEKQYPEEEDEEEEQRLQHKHSHHYNKNKSSLVEDEQDEIVEVLHLSVNIKKGEVTLELDCSFVRGAREVMIEYVVLHESDCTKSVGQPEPYGGPIFEDLDEDLQRAFHELVKARGLSLDVARYMMEYMSSKESTEYVRWLHKLKAFFTF